MFLEWDWFVTLAVISNHQWVCKRKIPKKSVDFECNNYPEGLNKEDSEKSAILKSVDFEYNDPEVLNKKYWEEKCDFE